jgi:hypothetical protein
MHNIKMMYDVHIERNVVNEDSEEDEEPFPSASFCEAVIKRYKADFRPMWGAHHVDVAVDHNSPDKTHYIRLYVDPALPKKRPIPETLEGVPMKVLSPSPEYQ